MAEDNNVLFIRSSDGSNDEIWDDSALIKAYDKAINLAKEEVSKRLGIESQTDTNESQYKKPKASKQTNKSHQKTHKKWVVGSPCRAIYSEDGKLYEAVITKMHENTGICTVKFVGYNNKEKVNLSSLIESEGLQSQIAQSKEAKEQQFDDDSMDYEDSQKMNGFSQPSVPMGCDVNDIKQFKSIYTPSTSFNVASNVIPPAPPLPPQLMARLPENDSDALSSMLMSWYISGFHTGYYHGLKQARSSQESRKK